jgi:plasmid maintenance system killer protein
MKESFYFPHDYEAANDPKVQALLSEYGGIGYGVFWRIIELLHSDEEHKIPMKQYIFIAIAKQMLASAEQIMAIVNFAINECELFETDGDFIWSKRVNRNFLRRKEISEKRSISGKLGAEKKWAMANAKQNLAKHGKGKEKKEKEIKEKEKEIKESKKKKTPTSIPEDFCLSDRVIKWAAAKNTNHLDEHLEHFISICRAKDYRYVDWDEAFMTAIRNDWAKINNNGKQNGGMKSYD